MQRFIYLIASLIAALSQTGTLQAGEVYDDIISKNLITVATDANWPPLSFLNDNNQMEGFDVDVARGIAHRLGVDIRFVTPSWDKIVAGNWKRNWDVHVGSMKPGDDRGGKLVFPAVYYFTPALIAVHQDSATTRISQLNGKRVGAGIGTSFELYLQKNLSFDSGHAPTFIYQIDKPGIKPYETSLLALDDLRLGDGKKLDAVLGSMPTIMQAIGEGYPVKIIDDPLFYQPLVLAIDSGDHVLAEKLSDIVGWMQNDGSLSKISMKWFGFDYSLVQ